MRGWVYVMTCRAMPGLVKVGATTKDPFARASELRGSNNPHGFQVEYDVLVIEPFMLERAAHERLAHCREEGDGQAVEFFRCAVDAAVLAIRSLTRGQHIVESFHKADRELILAEEREVQRLAEMERSRVERALTQERLQKAQAEEQERSRLAEEQQRCAAEQTAREAHEERKRVRAAWIAEQERRLRITFSNKLVVTNGLRMLSEHRLVMCSNCNRPLLSPFPVFDGITCDGCGSRTVIPPTN